MNRFAENLGILKDTGYDQTFTLTQLATYVTVCNFEILEARKFMFSPIGFPAEKTLERVLGPWGLNWIMANQLLISRKRD